MSLLPPRPCAACGEPFQPDSKKNADRRLRCSRPECVHARKGNRRLDGRCVNGHEVGTTGRSCRECARRYDAWRLVFGLFVRELRRRGHEVDYAGKAASRLTVRKEQR